MLCVGQQRTACTLLPCSTVLFSAVSVYVFYEPIKYDDDEQRSVPLCDLHQNITDISVSVFG